MEKLSTKIVNEINKEFNLELKTVDSSQMDEFINELINKHQEPVESDFETSARPLMKYLAENHNPHTTVIVESNMAQIMEGVKTFGTDEYIPD